jgi:hypothetical protein
MQVHVLAVRRLLSGISLLQHTCMHAAHLRACAGTESISLLWAVEPCRLCWLKAQALQHRRQALLAHRMTHKDAWQQKVRQHKKKKKLDARETGV